MNVLVMSVSNKIPMLKAVRYALQRLTKLGLLYGADTNEKCLGKFFVDQFWHCPPLNRLSFDELLEYCRANNISVIFPSRDGELIFFAEHESMLRQHGIHVMVSSTEAVRVSLDKLLFYEELKGKDLPVIPTSLDRDIRYESYVVKERFGAGSKQAGIQISLDEVDGYIKMMQEPIIQPYIQGTEYSVDMYISNGHAEGIVVRERKYVVNGESQITTTLRNQRVEELCEKLSRLYSFRGHIMFQIIEDGLGELHIVECNCRFGGASTLSIAAGLDSFFWFMQESSGEAVKQLIFKRAERELTLIRHTEDYLL